MSQPYKINNIIIIYIHGAYQTPWLWRGVIDDISQITHEVDHMLITLPGYYKSNIENEKNTSFLLSISEYIIANSSGKKIIIIGHSLGAAFACHLVKYIESNEITLCLSSMPINIPSVYVKFRLFMEKSLRMISSLFPVTYIPVFIRSKLITNYSDNNLLSFIIKNDEYVNLLCSSNNIRSVNVGCGYMDIISGGIKKQKNLVNDLKNNGVSSEFFSFGFTGHYPHQLNRFRYVRWIVRAIESA